MKITKILKQSDIIKALRTEPLNAGLWAWNKQGHNDQPPCQVCAVGAVVRHALKNGYDPSTNDIDQIALKWTGGEPIIGVDPIALAGAGHYWNALSCLFEDEKTEEYEVTREDRNELCMFVRKYFPKEIEVDVTL